MTTKRHLPDGFWYARNFDWLKLAGILDSDFNSRRSQETFRVKRKTGMTLLYTDATDYTGGIRVWDGGKIEVEDDDGWREIYGSTYDRIRDAFVK